MSKLLTALVAVGFGVGLNMSMAQNVDSQKDKAQAPTQGVTPKSNPAKDCAKLSGKEKDECIQATPAGPVDMTTGQGNKAKSTTAKERDREKAQSPAEGAAPVQSNSSLGHPDKGQSGAATGEGDPSNKTLNGKNIPAQSKDTVGHPEQRETTGEAQTLREPGAGTDGNAHQNPAAGQSDKKTR